MAETTLPNEDQIEYWNQQAGPRWVRMQDILDRQIEAYGLETMDRAGIAAGHAVVDIGCGCGGTTVEIARRVGRSGAVLGLDVSRVMLDRAEERARVGQMKHVRFVQADAQTYPFDPEAFDVAFSRFGVMFFEDPPAAFANIRRGLKPGGRLAFVCWRDIQDNPWMLEPMMAVADLVELPPRPEPREPGPFALAESGYLNEILTKAGYQDIDIQRFDRPAIMGAGADVETTVEFYFEIGPLSRLLAEESEKTRTKVADRLRELLTKHETPDGIQFPSSTWQVTAAP